VPADWKRCRQLTEFDDALGARFIAMLRHQDLVGSFNHWKVVPLVDVDRVSLERATDAFGERVGRANRVMRVPRGEVEATDRCSDLDRRVASKPTLVAVQEPDRHDADPEREPRSGFRTQRHPCRAGLQRLQVGFRMRDAFWKDTHDVALAERFGHRGERVDVARHL